MTSTPGGAGHSSVRLAEHHEPHAMSRGGARGPVQHDALGAAQRQRAQRRVDLGRGQIEQRRLIGFVERERTRQRSRGGVDAGVIGDLYQASWGRTSEANRSHVATICATSRPPVSRMM